MTIESHLIPPSPTAQQALVNARRGIPASGSTKYGLKSRGLVDAAGEPTELGVRVARHLEATWAANHDHLS